MRRLLLLALALAGCAAEPLIEATTALEDTASTEGPYLVDTVTLGVTTQHRVELHWATGAGDFIPVLMTGMGGERWQAAIPGQPAGTTVSYYVTVADGAERLAEDPIGAAAAPYRFNITP